MTTQAPTEDDVRSYVYFDDDNPPTDDVLQLVEPYVGQAAITSDIAAQDMGYDEGDVPTLEDWLLQGMSNDLLACTVLGDDLQDRVFKATMELIQSGWRYERPVQ